MAAFAVKVEHAVFVAVEIHAPFEQLLDLFRSLGDNLTNCDGVGKPVAGNHRVLNMFFEVVEFQICYRRNAALGECGVGFVKGGFTHQGHTTSIGHLKGKTHTGDARANHEIIVSVRHGEIRNEELGFMNCYRTFEQ